MIQCNECGNELKSTAKFCRYCGSKIHIPSKKNIEATNSVVIDNQEDNMTSGVSQTHETTGEAPNQVPNQAPTQGSGQAAVLEGYFFDYIDFFKETLSQPSIVFKGGHKNWVLGAISLVLYAIILAFNIDESLFSTVIIISFSEIVFVGLLFLLNNYLLGGRDTYQDALVKYGGLVNSQIILALVLVLIGLDSEMGTFIMVLKLINQLNIFNLYILNSQGNVNHKLDRYYQLIVSYIPFVIMLYMVIRELF